MGISQYKLAKDVSVPPRRINEIIHGKRSISEDTALRLSRLLWLIGTFLAESASARMILKWNATVLKTVLIAR